MKKDEILLKRESEYKLMNEENEMLKVELEKVNSLKLNIKYFTIFLVFFYKKY